MRMKVVLALGALAVLGACSFTQGYEAILDPPSLQLQQYADVPVGDTRVPPGGFRVATPSEWEAASEAKRKQIVRDYEAGGYVVVGVYRQGVFATRTPRSDWHMNDGGGGGGGD